MTEPLVFAPTKSPWTLQYLPEAIGLAVFVGSGFGRALPFSYPRVILVAAPLFVIFFLWKFRTSAPTIRVGVNQLNEHRLTGILAAKIETGYVDQNQLFMVETAKTGWATVAASTHRDFIPLCRRVFALLEVPEEEREALLSQPLPDDGTLPREWTREAGVTKRLETHLLVRGGAAPGDLRARFGFFTVVFVGAFLAIPFGPGPDWKWLLFVVGLLLGVWFVATARAFWGTGAGLTFYSDRVVLKENDFDRSFPMSEVSVAESPWGTIRLRVGDQTLTFWRSEAGMRVSDLVRTLHEEAQR